MEQNWDPEVKRFFIKILNSVSVFLLWLMASVTAGIYFQLAYKTDKPFIYTILFYVLLVITLLMLIRYLYKLWK
jgi:hypothetical protein